MIMVSLIKSLPGRIITKLSPIFKKKKKWQDIEYFDPAWKQRIVQMANFIEPETTILDLGCGLMWLKDYLPFGCTYIPVDYCKRSNDTVISDFNKNQFPELNADIAFISGCLEYIIDYKKFILSVCGHSQKAIVSYCTTDNYPNIKQRKSAAWANHLSKNNIVDIFANNNFSLIKTEITKTNNSIFVFVKNESQ